MTFISRGASFRGFSLIGIAFVILALSPIGSAQAAESDLKYEKEAAEAHTVLESEGASGSHGEGFHVLRNRFNMWRAKNYFKNGVDGEKLAEFQIKRILSAAGIELPRRGKIQTPQGILATRFGRLSREADGGYRYTSGSGIFTIESPADGASSSASLTMSERVSKDIEIRRVGGDILICMNGLSRRVDFPGWYGGGKPIRSLIFADGAEWSAEEIESRAVRSEPLRNLTLVQMVNKIEGTDKSDELAGTTGNDTFIPGAGDDTMIGAGGCDVYFRERNGGNDTICNAGSTGIGGILRFGGDITSEDVKISRQGADVLFTLSDGCVRVRNWYTEPTAKLGRVEFCRRDMTVYDTFDVDLLALGKPLVPRDEYYDTSVLVKRYEDFIKLEVHGAKTEAESNDEGCNAGFSAFALPGLAGLALLAGRAVHHTVLSSNFRP